MYLIASNHLGMHWCCTFECQWKVLCKGCPRAVHLERLSLFLSVSLYHMIWNSFPRSTHSIRNSLKCTKKGLKVGNKICISFHLITWARIGVAPSSVSGRSCALLASMECSLCDSPCSTLCPCST